MRVAKLAYIGLGVMGFPMAGHLAAKGGHEVTVYNRTAARAQAWVAKFGGRSADTPANAAEAADIVFSCVGDDPDLREVTLGANSGFQSTGKDTIFVDHTTASAKIARETGADLTVTKMIDVFYAEIQKLGGGRWDTSSLIRRIRKV